MPVVGAGDACRWSGRCPRMVHSINVVRFHRELFAADNRSNGRRSRRCVPVEGCSPLFERAMRPLPCHPGSKSEPESGCESQTVVTALELALLASVFGNLMWNPGNRIIGSSRAAMFINLIPLFGAQ